MESDLASRLRTVTGTATERVRSALQHRRAKPLSLAIASSCAAALIFPSPLARHEGWTHIGAGSARASTFAAGTELPDAARTNALLSTVSAQAISAAPALRNALPFRYSGSDANRSRAAECLAAAAWYEIGNDREGQRAVIQTVINRVNHPGFPNSVCGVVFQGSHLRTGCQFTFTCDGSLQRRRPSAASWKKALAVAEEALDGFVDTSIGTATHYHADYVSPWWSSHLQRLTAVGPHVFYRWSGSRGNFSSRVRLDAEQDYDALVRKSAETERDIEAGSEIAGGTAETQLASLSGAPTAPGKMAPVQPSDSAIVVTLAANQPSGRWAVEAMKACSGSSDCRVIGYRNSGLASANRARAAGMRDRPTFLFLRDEVSGMNLALWDCETIERPQKSQCLPDDGAALRRLMVES